MQILTNWIETLHRQDKLSNGFQRELVIKLSTIIMNNNYFAFVDTEWIQLTRTAMGMPMACLYASLYYAWKEAFVLLPLFRNKLALLLQFIDDIFGI